jgi:type I restriction enzyme S subunit
MNTYRKMKDTSVPWLGKIPEHWGVKRIKYVSKLKGRIGWQGLKSDEYLDEGAYLITGTDFNNGKINWNSCVHISKERFSEAPEIHIIENDLLITKDGTIGKVAVAKNCPDEVSLNSGVMLIRNIGKTKYQSEFLYHVLLSESFWSWFNFSQSGSSTIIHLYQEQFYNFSFPLPPLDEQCVIAEYLDKTTAKIDGLIAAQEHLIELLAEKRKALISRVVTKGLNPKAKLKDTLVSWIGKIPEHWEVKRLRYLCSFSTGDKDTVDRVDDGQYPFYVRSPVIERINSFTFDGEAILMAGDGVGAGKVFHLVNGKFDYHQRVYCLHSFKNIIPSYLIMYMCENFWKKIEEGGAKSTVDSVRLPMLSNFPITVPPLDEQRAIVEYLSKTTAKLDALAAKAEEAIALMKERRSALISAIVTGKVKVS